MKTFSKLYGARLTSREKEIRTLILEGLSSKLIAARLSISKYTVANHRKNIISKKGISCLKELAG
jgi:DNA-binding NarL/FixJ family response regulator